MISLISIKDNLTQILAITEKNVKLSLRFKFPLVLGFVMPIVGLIMPIIVMGQIFTFNESFGPWTGENFLIFQIVIYQLSLIFAVRNRFTSEFQTEKFWNTLQALIIAPFNRINLLFGVIFSHLIMISIPFIMFFVIGLIYLPISFFTILFLLLIFFAFLLIFSGIGIFIGGFAISKPPILPLINIALTFIFMLSAISFPFEFFPEFYQNLAVLNPLFYMIEFSRLIWLENDVIFSVTSHPFHLLIIIICTIIVPALGIITFNYIFKKFGIVGY